MVTQPVKFIAPSGCRRSFVQFQSIWAATILMDSSNLCSVSVWPCLEKAKVKRNWLGVELESCSVVTSAVSLCQNRRARSRNMSHVLFRTWSCTNKNCSTAHHPTHQNYKFDLQREFLFVFSEEVLKKDHPGLLNRQGRSCLYTKINTHVADGNWQTNASFHSGQKSLNWTF